MSQLNKALWTNLTRLKLLNKGNGSVRFLLDQSPFDDEDHQSTTAKDIYVIVGRIFPNSEIFKDYAIQIEMKLTSSYPMEPPEVRFLTPVYHPNVDSNGKAIDPSIRRLIADCRKVLSRIIIENRAMETRNDSSGNCQSCYRTYR